MTNATCPGTLRVAPRRVNSEDVVAQARGKAAQIPSPGCTHDSPEALLVIVRRMWVSSATSRVPLDEPLGAAMGDTELITSVQKFEPDPVSPPAVLFHDNGTWQVAQSRKKVMSAVLETTPPAST